MPRKMGTKQTTEKISAAGNVAIGTATVQVHPAASAPCNIGIILKADSTNTQAIYIGDSGVSASSGFKLIAGDSVTLKLDNIQDIYAKADGAGMMLTYIGM